MGKEFNKINGSCVYHSTEKAILCQTQEEYDKAKSEGYKDYPHKEFNLTELKPITSLTLSKKTVKRKPKKKAK